MKTTYDFSQGKRGAVIPTTGKTRITIHLDDDVLEAFRHQAAAQGKGYQTLIEELSGGDIMLKRAVAATNPR